MITVGVTREETQKVTSDIAIDFLGIEGARVLSTPNLILGLERTSRNLVFPLLDPGYDTVGTHVNVYHLAATPMGMTATYRAEVTSVAERRVNFKVEAFDEKQKIAEGTHQRAIVNVARFAAKMQEKGKA
ncbi:MAG: thioesterase family protein [Candidatus Solibacter usitatus]|nr:thioesterase family protein [Candidatus Solibacter usitatus]